MNDDIENIENSKNRDRSWRRAQRTRILRHRLFYYNAFYSREHYEECSFEERHRRLGLMVKTPKTCSCQGCGNPRKRDPNNDPIQEKVSKNKCQDAYLEWKYESFEEEMNIKKRFSPK